MSNATKQEKEIMDERATDLEAIGFVLKCSEDRVWYEKGEVKMIPNLMMCAPTKDWNEFILKHTDKDSSPRTKEEILKGLIPDKCSCHEIYKCRKKVDQDCVHCNYCDEMLSAMDEHALPFIEVAQLSAKSVEIMHEEVKRLRGLIKDGFFLVNREWKKEESKIETDWQQFKIQNNL